MAQEGESPGITQPEWAKSYMDYMGQDVSRDKWVL
jgi:hypothetical protein